MTFLKLTCFLMWLMKFVACTLRSVSMAWSNTGMIVLNVELKFRDRIHVHMQSHVDCFLH